MVNRPAWITLTQEVEVRKTLSEIGKLQAVKEVMELTKTAGHWGNSTDGKGVLLPHARNYNGVPFGLKEAKEYVEKLEAWKDPVEELRITVESIRALEESLEEKVKMAFPELSEENVQLMLKDSSFMNKMISSGSAANRFGI